MKITINNKTENYIAVFLTLLYSYATRSILSRVLFASTIQIYIYYIICYISLFLCFFNSFRNENGHLYAPSGFYSIGALFLVTMISMVYAGAPSDMMIYLLAYLIPFSLREEWLDGIKIPKAFTFVGIVLTLGTLLNYLLPNLYSMVLPTLFSGSDLSSARWVASMGTGFPGLFSQVNYTAFFLGVSIAAIFTFRNYIFRVSWPILVGFFFAGMLFTGKRGAVVYVFLTILLCYFLEGKGKEKAFRLFKIAAIAIAAYVLLFIIAQYTNAEGIKKIFETVQTFILGGQVDNTGRDQLQNQAWTYFAENPIFGIGWGNFRKMFRLRGTYVHCIYIQLLCEVGVLGASVYYMFFGGNLFSSLKKYRARNGSEQSIKRAWIEFSIFLQVYFLLFGLTENPIYDIEEMIVYMFAIGIGNLMLINSQVGEKIG